MSHAATLAHGEMVNHATLQGEKTLHLPGESLARHRENRRAHINDESGDDILLVEVGRGSREALSLLFRRHRQKVVKVACRILRDAEEAEDLCQEVFVYLFQRAGIFDPRKGSASSWIIQIAYSRAFTRRQYLALRKCSDDEESLDRHSGGTQESSFLNALIARELLDRLRESLSKEQFKTLELYFFEGYTLREIADECGQTLGCIRNRYYRSLERLRSLIFSGRSD